jgi:hypothetical protein
LKSGDLGFEAENETYEQPKTDEPRNVGGRSEPRYVSLHPFHDHGPKAYLTAAPNSCCWKVTSPANFRWIGLPTFGRVAFSRFWTMMFGTELK